MSKCHVEMPRRNATSNCHKHQLGLNAGAGKGQANGYEGNGYEGKGCSGKCNSGVGD